MNKVILKGRLTANPELKKTPNDISVTSFTVAVNRKFDREKADFINCEAWRNTAEFVSKYFAKGKEILVIGELHIDKSERDGSATYFTKVVADEVEFCGNKGDVADSRSANNNSNMEELGAEDDLPF